jgi:ATP-dependent protease ClpP protease subunit
VKTRAPIPPSVLARAGTHERFAAAYGRGRTSLRSATDQQPSSATLTLYGVVGRYWGDISAKAVAQQLAQLGADLTDLTVHLHSGGGDAFEGVAVFNVLRNHPARVTVIVDGLAASAASVIAMAGDEVVMGPGTQMLLHDAWMLTVGNAAELRVEADWLDKQSANLATVYAWRAGGAAEQWRAVMQADPDGTWYGAEEAVTAGLADRVAAAGETAPPTSDPVEEEPAWADDEAVAAMFADIREGRALVEPAIPAAAAATRTPERSPRSGHPNQQEETAMAFTPEQLTTMRQELGLAETADEATIVAALSEALGERAESPAASIAQVPEGMTLIETDVLNDLRTGAQAGREAQATLAREARERIITAAVSEGRITPARREHFAALYDADPEGTRDLLAALEPGLVVNTTESGHAGEAEITETDALYAEHWGATEKKGA